MEAYNKKIIRKKIKNLYIRIDDNLDVVITAPYRLKEREINNLLKEKDKWILEAIEKKKEKLPHPITSLDNQKISILGKMYTIKIINKEINKIYIKDDFLIVQTHHLENIDIAKEITLYLKDVFYQYLSSLYAGSIKTLKNHNINLNSKIVVKLMKSRYGSYSKKTNTICLNLILVKLEENLIKSVFFHEVSHIKHMNHQKEFYALLYNIFKDYDFYHKMVKAKKIRFDEYWFLDIRK